MQAPVASDSPRRRRRGRGAYLPDRLGSRLPASAKIGLRRRTQLTPWTVLHPTPSRKSRYKRGGARPSALLRGSPDSQSPPKHACLKSAWNRGRAAPTPKGSWSNTPSSAVFSRQFSNAVFSLQSSDLRKSQLTRRVFQINQWPDESMTRWPVHPMRTICLSDSVSLDWTWRRWYQGLIVAVLL